MLEDFGSAERLVEETQLSERQVDLALAYRDAYPDEIAEAITENRRPVEDWRELYPFVHFTAPPSASARYKPSRPPTWTEAISSVPIVAANNRSTSASVAMVDGASAVFI
jgi:hypothetical protein